MKLKPAERAKLMKGECPELVRSSLEFEIGEEVVLKTTRTEAGTIPEVSIRILERHKTKNGSWQAIYVLKDDRGLYVDQGIGYTRSPTRALDREAPILDPAIIEQYAAEAEQANALLQGENVRRRKIQSKESSVASSPRSQKAKERHSRALSRPAQVG